MNTKLYEARKVEVALEDQVEELKRRGPGMSSYDLVKRDLKETLDLSKRVRKLIQKQVENFENALEDTHIDLQTRIDMTEKLGKVLSILSQSGRDTAKLIVTSEPEKEEGSGLLEEMIG